MILCGLIALLVCGCEKEVVTPYSPTLSIIEEPLGEVTIIEEEIPAVEKKPLLAEDIMKRDYFTIEEREKLIDILNYELGQSGEITLEKISGKKDLITKIVNKIESAPIKTAPVEIENTTYSPEDYLTIRSILFNKLKQ